MDNYLCVNGRKIKLTKEQAEQLLAQHNMQEKTVELSTILVGETFRVGEYEFIVLEHADGETSAILNGMLASMPFGETNNFHGSAVDLKCNEFANEISSIVGKENLVLHTVDLTADDGLKDYGKIDRRVSLLTADLYRRYVEILDKFKPNRWWWTATPCSTARHDNDYGVLCVSPSGCISDYHCDYDFGVRPFCILKSTIFVSK